MKYKKIDAKPNILQIQRDVLDFWKNEKVFSKSLDRDHGEKVFYDGPPFPTGKPHHGTVLVSFIKDMIARYWTMRGYSVPRQWGWDCHGLPIETQAEAKLGVKFKSDIESVFGVDKFNEACHDIVSSNNDTWRKYVEEMARWVDYDGAYKTMDKNYMESVIWAFKQCYDKGLIYKDYRVTPYCYRCQTSLSISDTRESDSTRPKQDTWVMARFNSGETLNGLPVYYLAWTTTPWTLPSNMALAVGAELEYAYFAAGDKYYVAGVQNVSQYVKVFGKEPVIVKKCLGKDLVGKKYQPLFDYFANKAEEGAFSVIEADYVAAGDGVGIVHIAPAFGEDDYWACKKYKIPMVNPVDDKGCYTAEVVDFAKRNVMEANIDVIRLLRDRKLIVDEGSMMHNYPHCWRCRTPLIYKAMDAWYFNVDKLKEELLKLNENINWIPETVKHGRFGNWLENARDWNISRNRYWSTPIPVWECEKCHKRVVLGSIEEIYQKSGIKLENLHKQYMDKVTFDCECGGKMTRIPEVLDCWFESGSVPFARMHYPFENKEWFEKHMTSDFVVEYTGQIRCWFYYLLVLSCALFGKEPFKNAVVHGTVLAKDGKKLSKSSKNYTDPMELMQKYGTDAFRLYMYQSNAMLIGDLQFNESGLLDSLQSVVLPFWNACGFFVSYAIIDGYDESGDKEPESDNILDKWMLALLYDTEKKITSAMNEYQVDKFVPPIIALIDGLTNWFIRRSRRRFWGKGLTEDKITVYRTLSYVLVNTCKLMAPVAPIISEELFKNLTGEESVHLTDWPQIPEKYHNDDLLTEIDLVQNVIHSARSIRTKNQTKNRQPLLRLQIALSDPLNVEIINKYKEVIKEELNVKNVDVQDNVSSIATLIYKPNFATLSRKYPKNMPVIIKAVKTNAFTEIKDGYKINGTDITLDAEDVIVEYKAKEGLHVASAQGIVVSLDLTITDELFKEGIAREIVRNVQDARKQIGCEITDRIGLRFEGNYPVEWLSYVLDETLGDLAEFTDEDTAVEIALSETEVIKVFIKKK